MANLLRDNDIGLLVKPEAAEFAIRLDELLGDPERAKAMGDRAREIAKTTYSQEAIADKLEDFYGRFIAAS